MKIGILTFHSALNYGAVLQCHGLYSTLKALGHNAYVIDYRPPYLYFPRPEVGKKMWLLHPVKALSIFRSTSDWRSTFDKFFSFQKCHWCRTSPIYNYAELKSVTDSFDCIVVGSDQVWASIHNGNDSIWYGIKESKAKWITYAASAGDANFSGADIDLLRDSLTVFSSISVREHKLAQFFENTLSVKVPTVLDPTLLSEMSVWKDLVSGEFGKDCVVVYQARANDNTFRIAESINNQLGGKGIIVLDAHDNVKKLGYSTYSASPSEFVSIISNCKCLVTTSFHGTAFAIINEVPFYTLKLNDGADERVQSLLFDLNLEHRLVDTMDTPEYSSIDYGNVMEQLSIKRNDSMTILQQSLLSIR